MKAQENSFISITYTLHENGLDNNIIETVKKDDPLSFILGQGVMLPSFEQNLQGLSVNEKFNFTLPAKDAYGTHDDDMVTDVPINVFEIDGERDDALLQEGAVIAMVDNMGTQRNGTVLSVSEEAVTMDFNHPMAGLDLCFVGEVVDLRDATEEEIEQLHAPKSGGCCGGSGKGSCGCNGNCNCNC